MKHVWWYEWKLGEGVHMRVWIRVRKRQLKEKENERECVKKIWEYWGWSRKWESWRKCIGEGVRGKFHKVHEDIR